MSRAIVKVCPCGCEDFTAEEWSQLEPASGGLRDDYSNLEYRQCPECDSTITIEVDDECAEAAQ